ncbi:hypothetical protein B0H14DRAFT_3905950 [Mycena olivaceomarginata]|nr:hypothetical protein B0H14DRAFT_3905950 [Mycena olivaceomarginata]
MSLKLDLRLNTEHEANMRRTKAIAAGPIIPRSSRSASVNIVAAVGAERRRARLCMQTYLSTRPDCAAHHPGTVDEVPSLSVCVFFAAARCACEPGRALSHTFVRALLTPRRTRARASTPALLAPCVVVRVVSCIVQHEQALRLRIAPPRAYTPTLCLTLCAPLAGYQTRTCSGAHLDLALMSLRLQRHRLWDLLPQLRRCRCRWSNPSTGMLPFFPPRRTSTSSAPSAMATSPHPRGPLRLRQQRAGTTRVEPAPAPDAPPRAFTTAESSTRNGDVEDDDDEFELGSAGEGDNARSPPTSFEAEYNDEEVAETVAHHEEDAREEDDSEDEDGGEEDYHDTPAPHPWYKPSVPVLLALAPPIGNWLTGGDHVKDLLLLLLLVFYLHQIVEVPWSLYHAARPRRPPAPRDTNPDPAHIPTLRARRAARAQSSLRTLELGLLFLCLITPFLGVALLRPLASLSSPSSSSGAKPAAPVPISWFSTALFGLLVSRVVSHTSTLHSQVHAHSARSSPPSRDQNADAESTQAQLAALRAQVARLELAVAQLAAPDREDALYAYVEDALAPLEKGVRRVERRVGRLRAGRKELVGASQSASPAAGASSSGKSRSKTIFVSAQPQFPHTTAFALVSSWFGGPPPPPHTTYVPPPLSPTNGNGAGKRRALDWILEEDGGDGAMHVLPHPRHTHPAYTPAHADVDVGVGGTLLPLLRAWLAACIALALYPLYVVLKPVRGVGRAVGVGVGRGR